MLVTVAHFLEVPTEKNEKQQKSRKVAKGLFWEFLRNNIYNLLVIARKSIKLYKQIRFALSLHQVALSC